MKTKIFEIRDRATFIPVLCTKLKSYDQREASLLGAAGYSAESNFVMVTELENPKNTQYSCYYGRNDRTFTVAHQHIEENFDSLKTGDVIDVEFILGETTKRKEPQ